MKLIFRNEQKQNESSKKEKRVSRISHIETGNTVVAVGNGDAKNNVTGEQTKRSNSCETFKEIK